MPAVINKIHLLLGKNPARPLPLGQPTYLRVLQNHIVKNKTVACDFAKSAALFYFFADQTTSAYKAAAVFHLYVCLFISLHDQ